MEQSPQDDSELIENTEDSFESVRVKSSVKARLEDVQTQLKKIHKKKFPLSKVIEMALDGQLPTPDKPFLVPASSDLDLALKVLDFLRSGSDPGWKPLGTTIIELAKKGKH